jgi:hypothetical protein
VKSIIDLIKLNAKGYAVHPLDMLESNYIRVESPGEGYMRLVVELCGVGPRGLPHISVAHYFDQNGDACTDPEITFEVVREAWDDPKYWGPTSFSMSASGIYRVCVLALTGGRIQANFGQVRDNNEFCRTWNRNIKDQGFIAKFAAQCRAREDKTS